MLAGGRTHIKTFSFWSSHPLAAAGSELVPNIFYALHLDFSRHSFYLDLGFNSDGFRSIDRSRNFLFLRHGHHRYFGLYRLPFQVMRLFAFLKHGFGRSAKLAFVCCWTVEPVPKFASVSFSNAPAARSLNSGRFFRSGTISFRRATPMNC